MLQPLAERLQGLVEAFDEDEILALIKTQMDRADDAAASTKQAANEPHLSQH